MWNSSSDRALTQDSCAAKDCSFTGRRSAVLPRSIGDVSYVPSEGCQFTNVFSPIAAPHRGQETSSSIR